MKTYRDKRYCFEIELPEDYKTDRNLLFKRKKNPGVFNILVGPITPDIYPGERELIGSVKKVKRTDLLPSEPSFDEIQEAFREYLLFHHRPTINGELLDEEYESILAMIREQGRWKGSDEIFDASRQESMIPSQVDTDVVNIGGKKHVCAIYQVGRWLATKNPVSRLMLEETKRAYKINLDFAFYVDECYRKNMPPVVKRYILVFRGIQYDITCGLGLGTISEVTEHFKELENTYDGIVSTFLFVDLLMV